MKTAPDICSSFSLTETLPSMENQHCHKHVSPESEGKVQNKTGEESLVTQKKDRQAHVEAPTPQGVENKTI